MKLTLKQHASLFESLCSFILVPLLFVHGYNRKNSSTRYSSIANKWHSHIAIHKMLQHFCEYTTQKNTVNIIIITIKTSNC